MSNLRGNFGVAFSGDDKTMRDKEWKYDSRKSKWTVDIKANPPHLKLFEMNGGNNLPLNLGAVQYFEEILFEMEHKMPWPPAFLCFFYVIDAPGGFSSRIGQYSQSNTIMEFNAAQYQEGLYAKVDSKYFRIYHYTDSFGFGAGTKNFSSSSWKFRIRFELLNQRAIYLGDKGY